MRPDCRAANDSKADLSRDFSGFHIKIVEHFHMVRDEAHRHYHHITDAFGLQAA
jgi:hypothetical protein